MSLDQAHRPTDLPPTATPSGRRTGQELLDLQRAAQRREGIPDAGTRIRRIERLEAMLTAYSDRFAAALDADFGTRPEALSVSTEVVSSIMELTHTRKHLATWMKPTHVNKLAGRVSLAGTLRRDPLGVVGVIGAWNFPVQLSFVPAGAALGAGNRVVIRPSELTPRTAEVMYRAVAEFFDPEVVAVVLDEVTSGPEFAGLKFDHIMFTGSPRVGALVGAAAAANLVPHTLELGGKNPVLVSRHGDLERSARQVARARMVNGGQVCLCPDYVFVAREQEDEFVRIVLDEWRTMMPTVIDNPDFTSIINDANFERVTRLVGDAEAKGATALRAAPAGENLPDARSRKMAPTVLRGVTPEMDIDGEEVFGPVLAVHAYDHLDEAVEFVGDRPHPLTLYWYGPQDAEFQSVVERTRSGSVNVNDFAVNMLLSDLPFGGVGQSGYGAYHGQHGFDQFTHLRTVAASNMKFSMAGLTTPPFGRLNRVINKLQLKSAQKRAAKVPPRG